MSVVTDTIVSGSILKKEKIHTATELFITRSNKGKIGIIEATKYIEVMAEIASI